MVLCGYIQLHFQPHKNGTLSKQTYQHTLWACNKIAEVSILQNYLTFPVSHRSQALIMVLPSGFYCCWCCRHSVENQIEKFEWLPQANAFFSSPSTSSRASASNHTITDYVYHFIYAFFPLFLDGSAIKLPCKFVEKVL